jgi:hypothetical protein
MHQSDMLEISSQGNHLTELQSVHSQQLLHPYRYPDTDTLHLPLADPGLGPLTLTSQVSPTLVDPGLGPLITQVSPTLVDPVLVPLTPQVSPTLVDPGLGPLITQVSPTLVDPGLGPLTPQVSPTLVDPGLGPLTPQVSPTLSLIILTSKMYNEISISDENSVVAVKNIK